MERASSMELQGIVPLLHLTVFLCLAMSVMLFMEKVIILVKLFRKRPVRHPERRYIWEPMREKDEVLVQIPMCNEKEVYQLSIGAACELSWTSDRIIIQALDDSTDPVIKARVVERNKEEVMKNEKENERNQEEEREGGSKVEATEDEIRTTEEKGKWKQEGDTVEERKSQTKRRKERPVNQDDEGRSHGMRSCMAMGCAAIAASALILVALANIAYVEEEIVYLFPT